MKEYVKVDENGFPIDNYIMIDEEANELDLIPSWFYQEEEDTYWWKPKYDFTLNKWIESLTEEEIALIPQESEPSEIEKLKVQNEKLKEDNELNSLAIMELAELILGGM